MMKLNNRILLKEDIHILPGQEPIRLHYILIRLMELVLKKLPEDTRIHTKIVLSRRAHSPCRMCQECANQKFKNCKNVAAQPIAIFRHVSSSLLSLIFDWNKFIVHHNIFMPHQYEHHRLTLIVKLF
jgi:hypothetical protein